MSGEVKLLTSLDFMLGVSLATPLGLRVHLTPEFVWWLRGFDLVSDPAASLTVASRRPFPPTRRRWTASIPRCSSHLAVGNQPTDLCL